MDAHLSVYDFLTFSTIENHDKTNNSYGSNSFIGEFCYEKLTEFFQNFVPEIRKEWDDLKAIDLLKKYEKTWKNFKFLAKTTNGMFTYLNRHWIQIERNRGRTDILKVEKLAYEIWKRNVFDDDLKNAVLDFAKSAEKFEKVFRAIQMFQECECDQNIYENFVVAAAIVFVLKLQKRLHNSVLTNEVGSLISEHVQIPYEQKIDYLNRNLEALEEKNYIRLNDSGEYLLFDKCDF